MAVNEVTLIGNIGNDPEIAYLPSGATVANFTVATTETWMDKQTNQKQEKTEWHRCKAFDRGNYKMGEYIGQSCKKGTKIYVKGSLETHEWEKDGIKRYTTEIKVDTFEVLANGIPKDQQGQAQQAAPQGGGWGQQPPAQQPQPQSYGSLGNAPQTPPQGDQWSEYEAAGKAQGHPVEAVKKHPSVNGDLQKAIAAGLVVKKQAPGFDGIDDSIPF